MRFPKTSRLCLLLLFIVLTCVSSLWVRNHVRSEWETDLICDLQERGIEVRWGNVRPRLPDLLLANTSSPRVVGVHIQLSKTGGACSLCGIEHLQTIRSAELSGGELTKEYAKKIVRWPALDTLRLRDVTITASAAATLANAPHLRVVYLENCHFNDEDDVVAQLSTWDSLSSLHFRQTAISDASKHQLRESLGYVLLWFDGAFWAPLPESPAQASSRARTQGIAKQGQNGGDEAGLNAEHKDEGAE